MARAFALNDLDPRHGIMSTAHVGRLLLVFVGATFALGGSARADIVSLILLRPFAAIMLVFGLMSLTRLDAKRFRPLWTFGGASALLALLTLIPLPPAVWLALPGRETISEVFTTTGIAKSWQPLSIDPFAGWNSLFSMVVPAAALVLMAAAGERVGGRMLKLLVILVFVSAFLGILQVIGGPSNGFYLYRIVNWESATGLFANRNHNAMFLSCGYPLLAAWASGLKGTVAQQKSYGLVALAGMVALLPMILITESRTGILTGAIGLVATALIYRRPEQGVQARGARPVKSLIAAGMAIVTTLVVILLATISRQTTIDRLLTESIDDDLRFAALPHIWRMGLDAFPFGWGAGSFVNTYKIFEPDHLLSENYLNHAHNDLLEVFVEFGIGGLALILVAAVLFLIAAKRLWSLRSILTRSHSAAAERVRLGWTGLAILLILAVGSLFDYPLRTPSLALLAAVSAGFVVFALDVFHGRSYGQVPASNSRQGDEICNIEEGSKA